MNGVSAAAASTWAAHSGARVVRKVTAHTLEKNLNLCRAVESTQILRFFGQRTKVPATIGTILPGAKPFLEASMPRTSAVALSTMLFVTFAVPADAALITFSSGALFTLAAPGLPVETFEAGFVSPGGVTVCSEPLSSAVSSACFAAGALLPGVTYSVAGPGTVIALLGANFSGIGNTSKVLGANAFSDTTDLTFASTVNAFGFDVFGGTQGTGLAQISIFDPANLPLGMFTIPVPLSGPGFFGKSAPDDSHSD
jgi:hypothetical protein